MGQMSNWNKFVQETLKQKDKSDKWDKGNLHAQLDIIKRVENNSAFSEKERLKDGESK